MSFTINTSWPRWRRVGAAAGLMVIAGLAIAAPAAHAQAAKAKVKAKADTTTKAHADTSMGSMPGMSGMAGMDMADMPGMSGDSHMPPMARGMEMPAIPGFEGLKPNVALYRPSDGLDVASLPMAMPSKLMQLKDGDTLTLVAMPVRRMIKGREHVIFGFNGQYPGPLIRVKQNTTLIVRFTNKLNLPSAVHWHGVRLDNRYDGAVGVTQDAVPPGGSFTYTVHFVDAGIFWYHPHVREDIEQGLGLFGNMMVDSPDPNYYSKVNREEFLMLDDMLIDRDGIFPFGKEAGDFSIMGRFGNVFMINGEPDYKLNVKKGEVVRFFLTDVSNTRMYNLSIGDMPLKLVAADLGKYEHEEMVDNVVIAVAQRYVVEAKFDKPGTYAITNQVWALANFTALFVQQVDTLGLITVGATPATEDNSKAFSVLRTNADVKADIDKYRKYFDRPVDKELLLTVNMQGLPTGVTSFMAIDTMYFPPAEWADGMPDMNWSSSSKEVHWILRDVQTGKENMDINWHFKKGDVVKIRITNDGQSMHPMSHPIHFHGQRFLIVARNGVPEDNLVWRDTAMLPVGTNVDILLEASNPGKWMIHCHIAEHLEAGMHMVFVVDP